MHFLDTLAVATTLLASVSAQIPATLVGTWSTKANQTLTGPGFYDPINEKLIEPLRTGISYSFTADGHYEEAYYRAISNPRNPSCPSGIMQWQHGSFVMNPNGSLSMSPIIVDGRQLLSSPCSGKNSIYTRYNQTELFQSFQVLTDPYHGIPRLNLFRFDGSPMQPMYLRYSPPQMLPTTTLNPLKTSATANAKRDLGSEQIGSQQHIDWMSSLKTPETVDLVQRIDTDRLWWIGLSMTGIGGLLYLGPRRLGIHV